ncbi:unnamed protein product [Hermetia illucens]|nr:unnamed protein product [Hermetia illucens]
MSFNYDELNAPEWIGVDFLREVLKYNEKSRNISIHNYKITPATALGDHFASVMFRVNINYSVDEDISNKNISIIIKTVPTAEGYKKGMLDSVNVFDIEIFMYTKVLNKCTEILGKCGYTELLAPGIIYTSLRPNKVLVFEDLKEKGYFMLPRNIPNEYEIRLIFSKLAQLHAVTFKMESDGRDDLRLKGTLFGFSFSMDMPLFLTAPTFLAELVETIPGFDQYALKMRKINSEWLMGKCVETLRRPAAINVLNHGDFHVRNMMFKRNGFGPISELALVDFQIPHWGSPAFDLLYMSAAIPFKLREMALRHYFNIFIDVLVKTGFKGVMPTYEQLQNEIDTFKYLDLFVLASMVVFLYVERDEMSDEMDKLLTDSAARRRLYNNEKYIAHVKEILPKLLDKIDVEEIK